MLDVGQVTIAIVPSAPVLVPELGAGVASELAELRAAVQCAVSSLPSRWLVIGVGPSDEQLGPDTLGTFCGYGVDVPVALGPDAGGPARQLPLCALLAGWLRGQANPQASVEVRVFADDLMVDVALARGRELRADLDGASVGVLVIADGAHTLSPTAPGGYEPDSIAVQQHWDDALATADVDALAALDGVLGRVAYQVLAGLTGPGATATELYRGAPYGVGYFVGSWVSR